MNTPSRRAVLASVAAGSLAGCFSTDSEPDGSKLGAILVANSHDESHTIDLKVEWEGELVHDQSYDLPADDPESKYLQEVTPEPTWPKETGDFTLSARSDGDSWQSVTPEDHDNPDCFAPNVMVDGLGLFGIGVLTTSKRCTDRDEYPLNDSTGNESATNGSVGNSSDTGD